MSPLVFLALIKPPVSDLDVALRIGLALLLGGLIGFEREMSHQAAGLRTHIAVALGAALFGVISVHGFDAYVQSRADSNYQVDVTRVASQVVVGIGFLGGGAIIKHGTGVRGLTTAASLWVTSAIGLAVGVGAMVAATITTGALLLSLVGLRGPRRLAQRLGRGRTTVVFHLREGADASDVVKALYALEGVSVQTVSVRRAEDQVVVEADVVGRPGGDVSTLLGPIGERDDVIEVDMA